MSSSAIFGLVLQPMISSDVAPSKRAHSNINLLIVIFLLFLKVSPATSQTSYPGHYNVVWNTPSKNSAGSMPIGNGEIGMNVWVEENGDLLLLISKTDSWDDNSRIVKLGRVRISLSPSLAESGHPFIQELKLKEGMIEITAGHGGDARKFRIWVDANHPVIRVECDGAEPASLRAQLELWRTKKRPFVDTGSSEYQSCWHMLGYNKLPGKALYNMPDTVLEDSTDRIVWYHRNTTSVWPIGMKLQGLESVMNQLTDPLQNRTFGAAIKGPGLIRKDSRTLASAKPARSFRLSIYPLTAITPTSQAWQEQLDKNISVVDKEKLTRTFIRHKKWWSDFWQRSRIDISGSPAAEAVTRACVLQRWMNGCAGRGVYPFKFNGSIFTVENRNDAIVKSDPDWRAWGGDFWYQNTRLPYWPMLASGDYDLMKPLFRMYMNTLPLAKARNRIWFNCEGAFIPETMSFWGMFSNFDYGWDRTGKQVTDLASVPVRWIWSGGLDLSMMMLDYYDHTQDKAFLTTEVIPWADAMILYFDTRFKRDAAGKLVITPAQVLEELRTGEIINPATDVAGLLTVVHRLLALPVELTESASRERWIRFQNEIPNLPLTIKNGKKQVIPAEKFGKRNNGENPELYTVFPFRIYGVGKPDLATALNTFEARVATAIHGWQQSSIQAAYLGIYETAKTMMVSNASRKNAGSRFPAFWGTNYDWVPDQCHGGNLLNTCQTMLMQTDGRRIYLFPAWPKEWDVNFKLHAPYNTVVAGVLHNGKLVSLKVTPKSRTGDVVNMISYK